MTKHFTNQIESLKKKILHLTAMVEQSLTQAVRAINDHDIALADKVIGGDEAVDEFEVEVEEECLKTLALYQPVAIDLRFIVAVLKINSDLERIGDLAVNIAQRAKSLADSNESNIPIDLSKMSKMTLSMVKKSADALIFLDAKLAREVGAMDDEVDDMHKEAYLIAEEKIKESPEKVNFLINLVGVSRYLERIADHATNIAEDVIYMIEGNIVRHKGSI